jgi:uncharacterized protein YndB with AHSA1/START domain
MKTGNKLTVTTPSDLEIVMTRSFNAPRRLVWEAMTKPELIRRWLYAPEGWQMSKCEMDVRVNGNFKWAWNDAQGTWLMTITGTHREVSPPHRIVHTETMRMGGDDAPPLGELVATVELTEQDERTTLRMTLVFNSKEERDGALQSGMEHGVSAGYDALDGILASMRK